MMQVTGVSSTLAPLPALLLDAAASSKTLCASKTLAPPEFPSFEDLLGAASCESTRFSYDYSTIMIFTPCLCSYADANTLFVSFISRAKGGLAGREPPYPSAIMHWSAAWYAAHCFQNMNWGLQSGQDFAIGNRKVGGNAQSFGGGRWVHHTSFLHDADFKVMSEMLSLPKKQPDWRKHRDHRCSRRLRFVFTLRTRNVTSGIF